LLPGKVIFCFLPGKDHFYIVVTVSFQAPNFRMKHVVPHAPRLKVRKTQPKPVPRRASQVTKDDLVEAIQNVKRLAASWRDRLPRHGKSQTDGTIRLASECAGYGSDIIAMHLLGHRSRTQLVLWSENCSTKQALHKTVMETCGMSSAFAKHTPDVCDRNTGSLPTPDLYIGGYPCPSWSKLGKGKGVRDSRGFLTLKGIEFIAEKRPRMIVLEQVSNIKCKKFLKSWNFLVDTLEALDYTVSHSTLNTKDFAIPQSRPRVYLLAVARESVVSPLVPPSPRSDCPANLSHFLDIRLLGSETLSMPEYEKQCGDSLWTVHRVLDVGSSERFQHAMDISPCLTRTRCQQAGYYLPTVRRRLLPKEMARLQGVPHKICKAMLKTEASEGLSANATAAAIGDAMSINILMTAIQCTLECAGFLPRKKRYWEIVPPGKEAAQLSNVLFDKFTG
jgi:site-specific DNA-cytosine methylase